MKKGFKLGKNEREVLRIASTAAIVVGTLVVPGLPMALAPFLSKGKSGKQNLRRTVKNLENKDLIFLSGDSVKLTSKGKDLLKRIEAEDITIEKPEKWDKIWRIVAYDIPDDDKKERDYFRSKLESLGFVKVQESMYAHPYDCIQEIAVLAQTLGLSPFVLYLTTNKLPRQSEYIKRFGL